MEQVKLDLDDLTKVYYSIGEVADMFNVNASLIRFWEKEFDIIKPKKNKKGNRLFTKEDVNNYQKIYFLVKERGYTLKGAREKLKGNPEDLENQKQIVSKLHKVRSFLHNLKDQL